MKRNLIREYLIEFAAVILIIGVIVTLFGLNCFYTNTVLSTIFGDLSEDIGDWKYWLILIGPILLLTGGWYLYDTFNKIREFKQLVDIDSRSKFIKNLDRIEYLAWRLSSKYEDEVLERKNKLRIRK